MLTLAATSAPVAASAGAGEAMTRLRKAVKGTRVPNFMIFFFEVGS